MIDDMIPLAEARRLALAAQGFDRPRPRRPGAAHVRAAIHRLGLVQIDYANVLVPAHYQVLFSRLGDYRRPLLDELVHRRREFTEQWAHEASILPVDAWPLLRHRMETHRVRPWGFERFLAKHPAYVAEVLAAVRARGALTAEEAPPPPGPERRIPGSWFGTIARAVLEALFGRGTLAVADRRPNFARAYDLAERVIGAAHLEHRLTAEEAQRELLRRAARAHGVGTAADLADYYRMPVRAARPRLAELVERGALVETRVEGWREVAYLDPQARAPRRIEAASLLSPFDPLVWFRPRCARLFGFDYRVELFVPPAQRRWGYYVLPFLHRERLAARVDLKSDRPARALRVAAAYRERHAAAGPVAEALAAELHTMARWLGLESVSVAPRGDFARPLAAAVRALRSR
ncbi:MAG TPA: crosslink repair DNA glycosylase YcaQ family protein [Vicinamibacteria bacterium]